MPNYLGKLRSFLIIYYRVYAKELIAKVYAKDVKELIIYYYFPGRTAERIYDSLDLFIYHSEQAQAQAPTDRERGRLLAAENRKKIRQAARRLDTSR